MYFLLYYSNTISTRARTEHIHLSEYLNAQLLHKLQIVFCLTTCHIDLAERHRPQDYSAYPGEGTQHSEAVKVDVQNNRT